MRWVGENSMPSFAARPSSPGVSGIPNKVGRGMPVTPFGPPVRLCQLMMTRRMISPNATVTMARYAPRHRKGALHGGRNAPDGADRSPPLPQQFDDDAAAEHGRDHRSEIVESCPVDQLPARSRLGADTDHQREQHQRDQGGDQGLLEDECDARSARHRRTFGRGCCHAPARQTFSTSGRPRRPVGRKISTIIRIENAATSLYSTEKYADQSVSIRPIARPPSIAPGSEPMPPSTAAVKALMPATKPMKKSTRP